MALSAHVGSFNTGTAGSDVNVTGVGFTPKLVLFWWSGRASTSASVAPTAITHQRGYGWAFSGGQTVISNVAVHGAATTDTNAAHRLDACVYIQLPDGSGSEDERLSLNSFNSDGFLLDANGSFSANYRIHYLALGGTDITNIAQGTFTVPTVTGNKVVTGLGFRPDAVAVLSAGLTTAPPVNANVAMMSLGFGTVSQQAVLLTKDSNGVADAAAHAYGNRFNIYAYTQSATTSITQRASLASLDADGFTLNVEETNGTQVHVFWLAIRGGRYSIAGVPTRTDTANIVLEALNVGTPVAAIFASHGEAENVEDVSSIHDRWSFGAASSPSARAVAATYSADDADPTAVAAAYDSTGVYLNLDGPSTEGIMDLVSFDSDGMTLVMDNADGTANFAWTFVIGQNASLSPVPVVTTVTDIEDGQSFTVNGLNFGDTQGASTLTIGDVPQTVVTWSDSEIECLAVQGGNPFLLDRDLIITTADEVSDAVAVNFDVPTGQLATTITDVHLPTTWRFVTSPVDLVVGDQLHVRNIVGALPADFTLIENASWTSSGLGLVSFECRCWDWVNEEWGDWGTQSVNPDLDAPEDPGGVPPTRSLFCPT